MKAIFMGTPDFAIEPLRVLIQEGLEVLCVVTQPDKPKGRGNKMNMPAIKEEALKHNILVYQPVRVKDAQFVKVLKDLNPDIIIVVAFGQLLSKEILGIPKYGCINVHASLLPKYRGAAPINWVLINGENKTGITTMYMDEGLDTGDMILKEEMMISQCESAGDIHDRLSTLGAKVLRDTIKILKDGKTLPREKQDENLSSYAPIMNKELGNIDWNKTANDIINLIRGTNPWPSAYTRYNGLVMKIWKASVLNEKSTKSNGQIIDVSKEGIKVCTRDNVILIEEIQMPGKKKMKVSEYIKGNTIDKILLGE